MQPHTVSVVIPTYNRSSTIVRSINSVRFQTTPVNEIIVIDDGSTDSTETLVRSIKDPRIKYVKQTNQGANHARNTGTELASSFWIAFQDSDDVWFSNKIEIMFNKVKDIELRNKDCIDKLALFHAFYSAHEVPTSQNDSTVLLPHALVEKYPNGFDSTIEQFNKINILLGNYISSQTILMPRQTLINIGGFDATIVRYQDWELAIRIACNMHMVYISEPLVFQYLQADSISHSIAEGHQARKQIFNKHIDLYKQHPYVYWRQKLRLYYRLLINK